MYCVANGNGSLNTDSKEALIQHEVKTDGSKQGAVGWALLSQQEESLANTVIQALLSGTAGSRAPCNGLRSPLSSAQLNSPSGKTVLFPYFQQNFQRRPLIGSHAHLKPISDLGDGDPMSIPGAIRPEPGWVFLLEAECRPGRQVHKCPPQPVEEVQSSLSCPDGERTTESQFQAHYTAGQR